MGRCCVLFFLALLGASGSQAGRSSPVQEIQHEAENGMAGLAYNADLAKGFALSATLNLPAKAGNRGWYCVWLMVAESRGTRDLPAMLQTGLMRWDQSQFRPQPFLTTEHPGQGFDFTPVPGIVEGPHRFSISGDSSRIELMMDDNLLMSAPSAEFFHRGIPIYLKIAAEVWEVGDAASGRVEGIELESGGVRVRSPMFSSAFEDRGLKFSCLEKGRWDAIGRFEPALRFLQYVPPVCR